jgi:hypothetical protein
MDKIKPNETLPRDFGQDETRTFQDSRSFWPGKHYDHNVTIFGKDRPLRIGNYKLTLQEKELCFSPISSCIVHIATGLFNLSSAKLCAVPDLQLRTTLSRKFITIYIFRENIYISLLLFRHPRVSMSLGLITYITVMNLAAYPLWGP